MPNQRGKSISVLIIILAFVGLVTLGLWGFYLYTISKNHVSPTKNAEVSKTDMPSVTTSVGFVQEISQKEKIVNGTHYTRFIGLLGQDGKSILFYMTDEEFNNIEVFTTSKQNRTPSTLEDLKGGSLIRAIRTQYLQMSPPQSSVTIEIVK